MWVSTNIALEGRLIGAIEDKEWLYRAGEEADEAIV